MVEPGVTAGERWVPDEAGAIREALSALKTDRYTVLAFLTCVDHLADSSRQWPARYEVVYQLRNQEKPEQIPVRAVVDADPPHIASVHDPSPPATSDERPP